MCAHDIRCYYSDSAGPHTPHGCLELYAHPHIPPQVKPVLGKLRTTLLGSGAALLTAAVLLFGLIRAGSDADGMYGGCRGVWGNNVLMWGGAGRRALRSVAHRQSPSHGCAVVSWGAWGYSMPLTRQLW